jgi:hypothetical protein
MKNSIVLRIVVLKSKDLFTLVLPLKRKHFSIIHKKPLQKSCSIFMKLSASMVSAKQLCFETNEFGDKVLDKKDDVPIIIIHFC